MQWEDLSLAPTDRTETPCDCCNSKTIEVSGDIFFQENYLCWYIARWAEGHPEIPLFVTVYTGDWSENAPQNTRWGTRTEVRKEGCALLDWTDKQRSSITMFTPLDRCDVLNSPYASEFWTCVDAILMKDTRLENTY